MQNYNLTYITPQLMGLLTCGKLGRATGRGSNFPLQTAAWLFLVPLITTKLPARRSIT